MSLVNYQYIQTLTEDSVDEGTTIVDILNLHDDTVDTVVTVTNGAVTVVDSTLLSTVVTWLRANGIVDQDFNITSLMSTTTRANLRQLELIQCCISVSWTSNGVYDASGFVVPGRVLSVPIKASVRFGGFDYSGFANATYLDLAYGFVHPLALGSWNYSIGAATSADAVRIWGPSLVLWYQEADGSYSASVVKRTGYQQWQHTPGDGFTFNISGSVSVNDSRKDRYINITISMNGDAKSFSYDDPYPGKMLYGIQLDTGNVKDTGTIAHAQAVTGGLQTTDVWVDRTYLPDLDLQFSFGGSWNSGVLNIGDYRNFANATQASGNNYRCQRSSSQVSYPYIGGQPAEQYVATLDNVVCEFTGNSCLTSPLVSVTVSGSMSGEVGDVAMSLLPRPISSTTGSLVYLEELTVPDEGPNAYLVPVVPKVTSSGSVIISVTSVQGIPNGTSFVLGQPITTDLISAFAQAVLDYDTASIYEVVDNVTASEVADWFTGRRIASIS